MIGATLRQHLPIILLAVWALAGMQATAQEPLSTKDKKAIKRFEEAQTNIQYNQLELAEVNLQLAIERDPNFKEAYIVLGQVYAQSRQDAKAIEAFDQLIALDPNFYPPVYFTKGSLEIGVGKYAEAEKSFNQYLTFGLNHPRMDPLARQGLTNCAFAKEAIKRPVPFEPKNLGPEINSRFSEYFPCLTADEGLLLYTRRLEDPRSPSGYNEDFYYTFQQERDGQKYWQKARNLGPPVNSLANEGAPTVSADGQTIIFTACADLSGEYGPRRNGAGSCDLFTTRLSRDRWDEPRNLGNKVNTRNWETQPSYAADGKTLYFIRGVIQRGGGRQQDIWFSEYVEKKGWSAPQKLPNHINTPGREESVFAHPDGKTLYFSSDGHPGMGGLDIYRVRKNDDGEWGKPENLGYPINSHNDENSLLVSASGTTAYFASDREGGFGELDLYSFE
ncbi:MAG: tetratricopeptide repeat protein, partial [Bacteroidota bacterium]